MKRRAAPRGARGARGARGHGPRRLALLLTGLAGLLAAPQAQALCLPAVCTCNVVVTNIVFAAYNPLAFGNTDSTGSVKVTCGGVVGLLVPFTVDLGKGGGTSFSTRRMASGANTISYNVYLDSNYTTVWGDGTTSTGRISSSVLLDALGLTPGVTFTVYGRIPAGSSPCRRAPIPTASR